MGDDSSMLKRRVQKEVGVVQKSDVLGFGLGPGVALEDSQFHHWRRVDRTTISGRFRTGATSSGTLRLLDDCQLVPESAPALGVARDHIVLLRLVPRNVDRSVAWRRRRGNKLSHIHDCDRRNSIGRGEVWI
jgi:hypothetical protein